jgi:hypothetical protein
MAIPWTTALYVVRKVLPVVIEKAPDLLKTWERRRTASSRSESSPDHSLATLQDRLAAHEQALAAQTELLTQLQATLHATRRSLTIAWRALTVTALVGVLVALALLFRS